MESYQVNKINTDEFGRTNGIFVYNKPAGVSSHDIVYKFRRHFGTKKVGHAGTLDPFASGLLVVLVGKATKLSDTFLNKDKEYIARILLGIKTTSGDPEGDITEALTNPVNIDIDLIKKTLNSFMPEYIQSVPLFSSVKIDGRKLRELARHYASFKQNKNEGQTEVEFFNAEGDSQKKITLPSKLVKIYSLELIESGTVKREELIDIFNSVFGHKQAQLTELDFSLSEYNYIDIKVSVSKGTYIRQLAMDIGDALNIPSTLIALQRTKVGELSIEDSYTID